MLRLGGRWLGERSAAFRPEAGLEVKLISPAELASLVASGDFVSQLHIGTLMQATLRGLIDLPRSSISRT